MGEIINAIIENKERDLNMKRGKMQFKNSVGTSHTKEVGWE